MAKNSIFDRIKNSVANVIQQTQKTVSDFTRKTIERITPRQTSATVADVIQPPVEHPQKPAMLSAEGEALDLSTVASVQQAERELSGSRKAKDIANEFGVSVQKWVSIRNKIRKGDLYGESILERLATIKENLSNAFEQLVDVEYTYTNPDGTHETRTGSIVYFPNVDRLNEKVPYGRKIKLLHTFSDAKNYWGQIGGGAEYFGIVNIGNGEYQIVDLRNQTEYNNRGKMNGEIRAQKILKNIEKGKIKNEDE